MLHPSHARQPFEPSLSHFLTDPHLAWTSVPNTLGFGVASHTSKDPFFSPILKLSFIVALCSWIQNFFVQLIKILLLLWAVQSSHQSLRSYGPFPTDLVGHSNSHSFICDRDAVEKTPGIQQLCMLKETITNTQITPLTRDPRCCIWSPNLCPPWIIFVPQAIGVTGLYVAPSLAEAQTPVTLPLSSLSSSFPLRRWFFFSPHSSSDSLPLEILEPRVFPLLASNLPWASARRRASTTQQRPPNLWQGLISKMFRVQSTSPPKNEH